MNKIRLSVLLVLTGTGLMAPAAHAVNTTYHADDLFLGFRQNGTTQDILIDLGPAAGYRDGTVSGPLTTTIGTGLGTLLNSTFGSGWQTGDSSVTWGIYGSPGNASVAAGNLTDPGDTLYITNPEVTLGTHVGGPAASDSSTQGFAVSEILTIKTAWAGHAVSTNLLNGRIENGATSGSSTYTGGALAQFNDAVQFSDLEGNFGNGAAGTALDLFRLVPTDATQDAGSGLRGVFTVNTSGVVSYNFVGTPEPTTLSLLGGAGLLFLMRRRRVAVV